MNKKILFAAGLVGLGVLMNACECKNSADTKVLSQDKELRAVMDNFIENEVPSLTSEITAEEGALIRIVSLTVQQSHALLREEIAKDLAAGIAPEAILEAIYQCAPYTGFPRTIDAVEIARDVFKAKNVKVKESRGTVTAENRLEKGADVQSTLFSPHFNEQAKKGKAGMDPVQYFLSSNCFGDYYTREGLELNTREMLTMVILQNLGTEPQLKSHIGANLKIRTPEQVEQVIYRVLPYSGYPRTLNALRLLKENLAENPGLVKPGENWSAFKMGPFNDKYAQFFKGNSYLTHISKDQVSIGNVVFEPGARNNWHVHHAKKGGGQILVATAGRGYYQEWGKPAVEMKPGDVVNIPAGVKHWHGAASDEWFQHLAIEVPGEEGSNEWLEVVNDEEYAKAQAGAVQSKSPSVKAYPNAVATDKEKIPGADWTIFPVGPFNKNYAQFFKGKSYLGFLTLDQVPLGNVTFEPGCRNNWHVHHAKKGGGQILVATAGRGYYQEWGKPAVEMKPGDVVNIPAGVKHWHGAAPGEWFQHIAVEVPGEGGSNEWLEAVSDEDYNKLK